MNIVLLGAPGAGKGTQAAKLVDEFGFVHISTGDLLREAVRNKTDLGKKAKSYMDAGELVPDQLIIDLMKERLAQDDAKNGCLLDGFPRTTTQAVALDTELAAMNTKVDYALAIEVDPNKIIERLSSRRTCSQCGYTGSVNDEQCPKCGSEMFQRDDDKEETIKNRLDVYERSTAPLVDYYRGHDILKSVNGDQPVDKVFEDVKKVLGL